MILALIGTKMVGGCAKFTETRKSELDLTIFGGKIFVKKKIIKLSGVNFGALMILYSKIGRHVLTLFLATSQDNQNGPIGCKEVIALCRQEECR